MSTPPLGAAQPSAAQPSAEASGGTGAASVAGGEHPPRRRRRRRIVALLVVLAVLIGAWFGADAIARAAVTDAIRESALEQLGLPEGHPVEVELDGSVLAQLIGGRLDQVRIAAEDVPIGDVSGDVMLAARGVPIRDRQAAMDAAVASIALDEAALQRVLTETAGVPRGVVRLNDPALVLLTSIPLGGAPLELGIGLVPSAGEGDAQGELVLTPNSASIGEAVLTAQQVRASLGPVADAILQPFSVCVADRLPRGVTLSGVAVLGSGEAGSLVLTATVDGAILVDPALLEPGSC